MPRDLPLVLLVELTGSCHRVCCSGASSEGPGRWSVSDTPGTGSALPVQSTKGSAVCGRLCWAWGCVREAKLCTKVGSPRTEPCSGLAPGDRPPRRLLSQEEPGGRGLHKAGSRGRSALGADGADQGDAGQTRTVLDRGHSAPAPGPTQAGPRQLPRGPRWWAASGSGRWGQQCPPAQGRDQMWPRREGRAQEQWCW